MNDDINPPTEDNSNVEENAVSTSNEVETATTDAEVLITPTEEIVATTTEEKPVLNKDPIIENAPPVPPVQTEITPQMPVQTPGFMKWLKGLSVLSVIQR